MELKDILSISGRQGLYKLNTKTRAGVIATSLVDGQAVSARGVTRGTKPH